MSETNFTTFQRNHWTFLIKYEEEIMTNDDNLESNLLTSSLLKRHLVYMVVQDKLTTREQAIHHFKLIYAVGRLLAVIVYCFRL